MRRPALLALVLALGCGPARRPVQTSVAQDAGDGTTVLVPDWLVIYPDLVDEALLEVRAARYPHGWTVVILPGRWEGRPKLLVSGLTDPSARTSWLAWRVDDSLPVLPACEYEAANARCGCESGGASAEAEILADEGG